MSLCAENRVAGVGLWVRRLVLYPLLVVAGLHTLMTGSPVPFWHIEVLNQPTAIQRIEKDQLVLADGSTVRIPLINDLPTESPLFLAAVQNGVEINESGEVFGLLWADRICGNDPCVWRRLRVNLSELCGALNPDGIDNSRIHPEVIAFLAEHHRLGSLQANSERLRVNGHYSITHVRREFEYARGRQAAAGIDGQQKRGDIQ